jgi:hypothetical protein
MFCATEDSTGHTIKWVRSWDSHKWPTRNVVEHLWNITNTCFPISVPRIAAVCECDNVCKSAHNLTNTDIFTPVLSGSYDVWGGTHDINTLNTYTIYIIFTAYLTEMHETTCFTLQINRPSSLPTVRRSAKLGVPAFDSGITSHSNATGVVTATACLVANGR